MLLDFIVTWGRPILQLVLLFWGLPTLIRSGVGAGWVALGVLAFIVLM